MFNPHKVIYVSSGDDDDDNYDDIDDE